MGTPAYMAPELATAEVLECTVAVDAFSFGILLWTMFSRRQPYSDGVHTNPFHLMMQVVAGLRPDMPEGVPGWLVDLIQQCWNGDPTHRPTFLEILEILEHNEGWLVPADA